MTDSSEENECRICRGYAEPNRPLFHPCKCSGSIKYTHEDCLVKWLAESGSSQCDVCHHPFRFEPLYQPNTPQLLPTQEFLVGILWRIRRAIKTAARIALVFIVWLFLLPVATCWTWYSLFVKSPVHLPVLIIRRGAPGLITDAFRGCVLSVGIVFVFLGVSSLREYVRHIPDDDLDHPADAAFDEPVPRELELDAEEPLDVDEIPPDDDTSWGPENPNQFDADHHSDHEDEPEVLEELDGLVRDTLSLAHEDDEDENIHHDEEFAEAQINEIRQGDDEHPNIHDENNVLIDDPGLAGLFDTLNEMADGLSGSESPEDPETDNDSVGSFPEFDEDIAEVDALLEQEANPQADAGGLFGLFELDNPEEVPLEEVVGLRGHLRNLFDHAGTVLVSNALFLGIFTFIPLCIGRITLRVLSFRSFPIPPSLAYEVLNVNATSTTTMSPSALTSAIPLRSPASTSLGFYLSPTNFTWSSNITVSSNLANFVASCVTEFQELLSDAQSLSPTEPLVSYADNFLVVLLGYGVVSLGAISYVIINSLLRSRYPRFDSPMTRHVAGMLRYVATIVKILVLIVFEFGIFPLGCGWWLDICTLSLVGGTLDSRLLFCRTMPWLCTAGHWLYGIVYMVQISLFVSLLREVLRPELLWFLRNPDDPDFHPFRELVEKPLSRHARRMVLSVLIYIPLVVATVYVPSIACVYLLPHVFPLRFDDFSHSLIDVPFGNLLVVPLISLVHHARPAHLLRLALENWIDFVGSSLGILHLVAKNTGEEATGEPAANWQGNEAEPVLRMPDDNQVDGESEPEGVETEAEYYDEDEEVGNVGLRATAMMILAWATLVLCECFFLSAPTIVGRSLMKLVGLPVHHDLHSFGAGCYVLLMSFQLLTHLKSLICNMDTATLLRTAIPRIQMAVKGALLVALWLGVVPLLAGILLELTITVPLRVSHNETPYFYLQQDWALGLLIMKLWNKVVLAGRVNVEWRQRVERAREGGFLGLGANLTRTLHEVVLPVLGWALVALSAPYAFSYGLLPLLGCSAFVTGVVYRFSYLFVAMLYVVQFATKSLFFAMRALHDSIRDDRYLIGKKLHNLDGSNAGEPNASQ